MNRNINDCVEIYKVQLAQGEIQRAYMELMKYTAELKAAFPRQYSTGNISFGYMDYTYFPFFNEYLRSCKLRFGIVLNHEQMRYELWLMGQNSTIQKRYWQILKNQTWNKDKNQMPKYSVLEVPLVSSIDFNKKDDMTQKIFERALTFAEEIQTFLKEIYQQRYN